MPTKYIFVTGGVVSSLGKGLASASIGCLLEGHGYKRGDFPVTEAAAQECLVIPIYSELTEEHRRSVVEVIGEFFGA